MLLCDHYISPSEMDGLGVFAAEDIAAGAVVWVFHPVVDRVVDAAELDGLPDHVVRRFHHHSEYYPERRAFIVSADGDYFMNHSDDPNIDEVAGRVVAVRFIRRGEELACNYRVTRVLAFDPDRRGRAGDGPPGGDRA